MAGRTQKSSKAPTSLPAHESAASQPQAIKESPLQGFFDHIDRISSIGMDQPPATPDASAPPASDDPPVQPAPAQRPVISIRLLEHARALPEIAPGAPTEPADYAPTTIEAFKDEDRRTMRVVIDAETLQPSKQEFAIETPLPVSP